MEKLKELLFVFICVTTCVVFVTAAYITVFWKNTSLEVDILWEILIISFLTSLGVYFYPGEKAGSKTVAACYILHYIYVNIVVLGCGIWFEWFYVDNLAMVLGMVLAIAAVFFLVSAAEWNRTKRMAALMNERLKGYQQGKEPDSESMDKKLP